LVGKTAKFVLASGLQTVASGLATAFSVDGTGKLRHLNILNDGISGTVTVCIYSDGDSVVTYGRTTLVSGGSVPDVDLMGSALSVSGSTLISGVSTVNQDISFVNNLTVQYFKTSGTVTLTGIVDINKNIIQT
jgi:hypothetical protein